MALEWSFRCGLPNGLHARPASFLEEKARQYQSSIHLLVERSGALVDTRSVLALISAGILQNEALKLQVEGADEVEALADLQPFLEREILEKDQVLPSFHEENLGLSLPRSLAAAHPETLIHGTTVSRGLGAGRVRKITGLTLQIGAVSTGTQAEELALFLNARERLLKKQMVSEKQGVEAEIIHAQTALLRDEALVTSLRDKLDESGGAVGPALIAVVESYQDKLRQTGSPYLQERVLDLQDVATQLLTEIYGETSVGQTPILTEPTIVVAPHLTPGQFLALDRQWLRGLVLEQGGSTSHTVILARSFAIPTLVGVSDVSNLRDGSEVVLDAKLGILLPDPNSAVRRFYDLETRKLDAKKSIANAFLNLPGQSREGRRLNIFANVSSAEETRAAFEQGAEGIGLFRTEMLFMDRQAAPSEDEQTAIYSAALKFAAGRPVTFRALDIGGDKPVSYLGFPAETNPFLGCRGVRLYAQHPELIRTQLRALCRAAEVAGPAKIMVPMIACVEEMETFRALVEEVRKDFAGTKIEVGAMLEIPSAVFAIRELAEHADFFSIGTNDLVQYFLAADRDHHGLGALYSAFHPAFLRFLGQLVAESKAVSRPVGLCGELGENSAALPLLLGLGLDSISLGAPRISATKAALNELNYTDSLRLFSEILPLPNRLAVENQLAAFVAEKNDLPFLDSGLIAIDSIASTKHEVLKQLTDLLEIHGRTSDGSQIEEIVWQREETYSTGFGYGFAVPHGKTDHLLANSIAVARLRNPIEWGALDGQPVRLVILLAIRETDQRKEHLRIFSRLSRLIMREEFRAALENAPDAAHLYQTLRKELEPPTPTL